MRLYDGPRCSRCGGDHDRRGDDWLLEYRDPTRLERLDDWLDEHDDILVKLAWLFILFSVVWFVASSL